MLSLTITQKEIYRLLTEENLSVKAIAYRRGTSKRAVYKTIQILKKKAFLSRGFKPYQKEGGTCEPFSVNLDKKKPLIRLHGLQLRIKIINSSKKYKNIKNKSNIFTLDGSTIHLHKDSISIFDKNSYFGNNETDSLNLASRYINKLFLRLEDRLNIIILKSDYKNCKIVKSHYSETKNGLAKDFEQKDIKLKIKSIDDNKTWFTIDNSFNLHEAETLHPETAPDDMFIIRPFFNDLRQNPGNLLISEITTHILKLYELLNKQSESFNILSNKLNNNEKFMIDMGTVLKNFIENNNNIYNLNNYPDIDILPKADYIG